MQVIFERRLDNIQNKINNWGFLTNRLKDLKQNYKVSSKVYDSINEVINWVEEYDNASDTKQIEHLNKVNSLLRKYWKVSRLIKYKDSDELCRTEPICYLYPYEMRLENETMFAIVSAVDLDDFIFSRRMALGETSFNFTMLGNHIAADEGIIFDEVTEEEMIANAKNKCEELFEQRYLKNQYTDEMKKYSKGSSI